MTSKAFKASWIIQVVVFAIFGVGGLLMVFSPEFFMADEVKIYLGQSWAELQAANARLITYFMHDIRLLGIMQVCSAATAIMIVLSYYRRGDKTAWILGLINATLVLAFTMLLNLPIGEPGVILSVGVLMLADYAALALGATHIFGSKGKQSQTSGLPASTH